MSFNVQPKLFYDSIKTFWNWKMKYFGAAVAIEQNLFFPSSAVA